MNRPLSRDYRQELYDRYVTIQNPTWRSPVAHAERIWAAAAMRRLAGSASPAQMPSAWTSDVARAP